MPSNETRNILLDSLKTLNVDPPIEQNGKDFYKFFFTNFPDLRKYFKGAEHYTAEDVQKSERFAKQGQRLLLALHFLAVSQDRPDVIRAYSREMVGRHRIFKMDPALWHAFWDVWCAFLDDRGVGTAENKNAWKTVGKVFSDEAVRFTKELGL